MSYVKRDDFFVYLLLFGGLGLLLTANLSCYHQKQDLVPKQVISAIYFEHIGESNKIILPVVIFEEKPAPQQLKQVLGSVFYNEADLVQVHPDDFRKICSVVNDFFLLKEPEPAEPRFGTFRVTVAAKKLAEETDSKPTVKTRVFSADQFSRLLSDILQIEKESLYRNRKLRTILASLKGRITR